MEPQTESEAAGVRASRDVMQISAATDKALKRLSEASKDDVKGVAASQIELLSRFYDLSLTQAGHSFRWALVASIVGFLFFVAALGVAMTWGDGEFSGVARIATIGGVISEFIAGVNFYLYGRTLSQLTLFQGRLESTQRFLLANRLCEARGEEHRDTTRAQLINQLIQSGRDRDADLPDSPRRRRSAPEAEAVSGLPSAPPPPSPAAASVAAS